MQFDNNRKATLNFTDTDTNIGSNVTSAMTSSTARSTNQISSSSTGDWRTNDSTTEFTTLKDGILSKRLFETHVSIQVNLYFNSKFYFNFKFLATYSMKLEIFFDFVMHRAN